MDDKEKILAYIRLKGPVLPTEIAKHIEGESYLASAHLSELKELGKLKISNLKVGGGSPLYYLSGQESQLQNFANNLGEKAKKVYDLLKEKKILRDSKLVPVFRQAIRTTKDFAFPFHVNIQGQKELFWKWFLTSNQDAEKLLRNLLGIKKKEKTKQKPSANKPVEVVQSEKQETLKKDNQEIKKSKTDDSLFYGEVTRYFINNKILIVEENIIRKKTDIEFIIEVPSPLGNLRYFVKAKSKKKVNDGDLSSVFIQAQTKRLPALFLGKGDLTKKAIEMLDSEFKGMKFQKL